MINSYSISRVASILCPLCIALVAGCSSNPVNPADYALTLPSARIESREAPSPEELAAKTKVVILGTGTPIPDAFRAGSSIAVIHKGQSYLFDVGSGAIRQATIARYKYDIPSLCLLYTSPSPRDGLLSRMPSSA